MKIKDRRKIKKLCKRYMRAKMKLYKGNFINRQYYKNILKYNRFTQYRYAKNYNYHEVWCKDTWIYFTILNSNNLLY